MITIPKGNRSIVAMNVERATVLRDAASEAPISEGTIISVMSRGDLFRNREDVGRPMLGDQYAMAADVETELFERRKRCTPHCIKHSGLCIERTSEKKDVEKSTVENRRIGTQPGPPCSCGSMFFPAVSCKQQQERYLGSHTITLKDCPAMAEEEESDFANICPQDFILKLGQWDDYEKSQGERLKGRDSRNAEITPQRPTLINENNHICLARMQNSRYPGIVAGMGGEIGPDGNPMTLPTAIQTIAAARASPGTDVQTNLTGDLSRASSALSVGGLARDDDLHKRAQKMVQEVAKSCKTNSYYSTSVWAWPTVQPSAAGRRRSWAYA